MAMDFKSSHVSIKGLVFPIWKRSCRNACVAWKTGIKYLKSVLYGLNTRKLTIQLLP